MDVMNVVQHVAGLLCGACLAAQAGGSWPMFRGGPALAGVADSSAPGSSI